MGRKITRLSRIISNLEDRLIRIETDHRRSVEDNQTDFINLYEESNKRIKELGNQLKAFGIEMDRIEKRIDKLGPIFEITDKRIKDLEKNILVSRDFGDDHLND